MKKLLVTGGAGFIGSAFVRKAVTSKYKVVNFDALTYSGSLNNLRGINEFDNYKFINGNIRDGDLLKKIFFEERPDALVHFAAESHVDRSILSANDFIQTNIVGTYQLLEAANSYFSKLNEEQNFRFYHISTDEVFGSLGKEGYFTENSNYRPSNPYSASKAGSDHLVNAWNKTYDLPTLISHSSNNYGQYQYPEKLIPLVILNCLKGDNIPVFGDGLNIRDWIFVEDHVNALFKVLEFGRVGQSYNIGGQNEISNIEIIKKICAILDRLNPKTFPHSELINFVDDRLGHDQRYSTDISLIQKELKWSPVTSLDKGLEVTVKWYMDNYDW